MKTFHLFRGKCFFQKAASRFILAPVGNKCVTALWQALKIRGFVDDFPGAKTHAIFRVKAKKKVFTRLMVYFEEIRLVWKQETPKLINEFYT
jgi:hypothetical protein